MSVLLSGCGFHLQGTLLADKLPFRTVTITPDDPFDPVYKQLRYQLEANRVCVKTQCSPCCTTQPCIRLVSSVFTEIPFVYGPDGDVRREKIIFELQYEYNYKIRTITTRRFWQLNLNHNLANIAEKEMIKREMIVDAVEQLLVQLTPAC
jgi:outer membrane lipopolysaccharide assembly protein LptE/RlpB